MQKVAGESTDEYLHPLYGRFRIGDRVQTLWGGEAVAGNIVRFMPGKTYDVLVTGFDSDGNAFTVDRPAGGLSRLPTPDVSSEAMAQGPAFAWTRKRK